MDDVPVAKAKERLEELIHRVVRGEDVRIVSADATTVRLVRDTGPASARPERKPGRWKDRLPQEPDDFFDPLPDSELRHWYGDIE